MGDAIETNSAPRGALFMHCNATMILSNACMHDTMSAANSVSSVLAHNPIDLWFIKDSPTSVSPKTLHIIQQVTHVEERLQVPGPVTDNKHHDNIPFVNLRRIDLAHKQKKDPNQTCEET